jgi:hypothetical protein
LQPYIDNGEDEDLVPWPEAPTYPDFANFPKRLVMPYNLRLRNNNAATDSSHGSSITTSTQGGDTATGSQTPTPGTVQGSHHNLDEESIDIHHRATALSQLTTLGREDYKAAVARHSARTKEWERITTNSNALARWIEETVHPSYHYLREDKDSHECHNALQGQYQPLKTELFKQAKKDYLLHIVQANTWDQKGSR